MSLRIIFSSFLECFDLEIVIFGNFLNGDKILGANIGADTAVFTALAVDYCSAVDNTDKTVGAVVCTVTTTDAAVAANSLADQQIVLRSTGNKLGALVINDNRQFKGAGAHTVTAAYALGSIDKSAAVYHFDSVITADFEAVAEACTTKLAQTFQTAKLCGFSTAGNTCSGVALVELFATAAADKCNIILALAQVVESVDDNLLSAGNRAGNTANTLAVINNSAVVNNRDCAFGASFDTVLTAYAAPCAYSVCLLLRVLVGAGDEVGGIIGDSNNELLNATVKASAAAITQLGIDLDGAVIYDDCVESAALCTVTAAYAAISTFGIKETGLNSLGTAFKAFMSSVVGTIAGTLDVSLLMFGFYRLLTTDIGDIFDVFVVTSRADINSSSCSDCSSAFFTAGKSTASTATTIGSGQNCQNGSETFIIVHSAITPFIIY